MSGREWKPGDVAMVSEQVCIYTDSGWEHGAGDRFKFPKNADARPLLVIDPEDREQVERLEAAVRAANGWNLLHNDRRTNALRDALRSLLAPPTVFEHYAPLRGNDPTRRALCGKVWEPRAGVASEGRCPECVAIVEAGWVK